MIKVCWVQHASEWPLWKQIALALQDHDIDSMFVCISPETHEQYRRDGFESYLISEIFQDKEYLSQEQLTDLDFRYGPPGIKAVGSSDVRIDYLFGNNQKEKEQCIGRAYRYWENFFAKHAVDHIIVRETATFATRTVDNVARARGIPVSRMTMGPSSDSFLMNDVGEKYVWKELLDALSLAPKTLTEEQRDMAREFVKKCLGKQDKRAFRFGSSSLLLCMRRLVAMRLRDTRKNQERNPVQIGAFRYTQKKIVQRLIWKYVTPWSFAYDTARNGEKFVYFPFSLPEEAGYLVNAHYFARNQLSLIREVALSLPSGYLLYYKGHPVSGELTYSELRQLKRISNVRVLNPSVSSRDIIEQSQAVVVIHGTTGWEAFLLRKPVVCLGPYVYYAYSELVYKVYHISQLPSILWKAMKQGSQIYTTHEEEWLRFIYHAMGSCGRGFLARLQPPFGFPSDQENAKQMAEFIAQKIRRDLARAAGTIDKQSEERSEGEGPGKTSLE